MTFSGSNPVTWPFKTEKCASVPTTSTFNRETTLANTNKLNKWDESPPSRKSHYIKIIFMYHFTLPCMMVFKMLTCMHAIIMPCIIICNYSGDNLVGAAPHAWVRAVIKLTVNLYNYDGYKDCID